MPLSQSVALQSKQRDTSGIPPPLPQEKAKQKKLEMLPYPHKINWRILTNVCYSFTGSETLDTYIFKTVH